MAAATDVSQFGIAFRAYHQAILPLLQTMLASDSQAIGTVDGAVNAEATGPRITLQTAADGATGTSGVVAAYVTFFHSVRSQVALSLSAASANEQAAVTNVLGPVRTPDRAGLSHRLVKPLDPARATGSSDRETGDRASRLHQPTAPRAPSDRGPARASQVNAVTAALIPVSQSPNRS